MVEEQGENRWINDSLWGNHIFDYILWMFGEKPTRVYCEAYGVNSNWEGEDEVSILIGFKDSRYATVKMSWNTKLKDSEEWDGKERCFHRLILSMNVTFKEQTVQCI